MTSRPGFCRRNEVLGDNRQRWRQVERRGAAVSTSEREDPEELCHVVSVSSAEPKGRGAAL